MRAHCVDSFEMAIVCRAPPFQSASSAVDDKQRCLHILPLRSTVAVLSDTRPMLVRIDLQLEERLITA